MREIRGAREDRVILSSEFLAHADEEAIRAMVADLDRDRTHVVITLRPIARMLSSLWQQRVQIGQPQDVHGVARGQPRARRASCRTAACGTSTATTAWSSAGRRSWAGTACPSSSSTAPTTRGSSATFEGLLALRPGTLQLQDDYANRSLTLGEARAIRVLNQQLRKSGLGRADLLYIVHNGAARYLKVRAPLPGEAKIRLPEWAGERAARLAEASTEGIAASGVRVVGDLSSLRVDARARARGGSRRRPRPRGDRRVHGDRASRSRPG